MIKKKLIAVALSGGVDSSVAAVLLKNSGYEVIGITMDFCGASGVEDAKRAAKQLGIKHYVFKMQGHLQKKVIEDFCLEYLKGRTPNPCVRCNQYIKFGVLLKKALDLGASYLATGHYARVEKSYKSVGYPAKAGSVISLRKAKDLTKDQSYFLYRLSQKQLKHILFPLGGYTKIEVRQIAKKAGLSVVDRAESQEICFLPRTDYRDFLMKRCKKEFAAGIQPGNIVDKNGRILGRHKGIAFYTIGQRQGIGVACGFPVYVAEIDAKNNKIVLGKKEDVLAREFLLKNPHFIAQPPKKTIAVNVKIRYNHKEAPAQVVILEKKIRVIFKIPQFAITPGQSAVFYDKNKVIGGGIIDKVVKK
ncbi:MAG: tRNA 2-thiouridine(34) synthase MnmA [Candidatus Omnitrophota bacterium]